MKPTYFFQNAVSVYCRLGFARRKNGDLDESKIHSSWTEKLQNSLSKRYSMQNMIAPIIMNNL